MLEKILYIMSHRVKIQAETANINLRVGDVLCLLFLVSSWKLCY